MGQSERAKVYISSGSIATHTYPLVLIILLHSQWSRNVLFLLVNFLCCIRNTFPTTIFKDPLRLSKHFSMKLSRTFATESIKYYWHINLIFRLTLYQRSKHVDKSRTLILGEKLSLIKKFQDMLKL